MRTSLDHRAGRREETQHAIRTCATIATGSDAPPSSALGSPSSQPTSASRGDGTFFYRLPSVNMASPTGKAYKNSACHWPPTRSTTSRSESPGAAARARLCTRPLSRMRATRRRHRRTPRTPARAARRPARSARGASGGEGRAAYRLRTTPRGEDRLPSQRQEPPSDGHCYEGAVRMHYNHPAPIPSLPSHPRRYPCACACPTSHPPPARTCVSPPSRLACAELGETTVAT